MYRRRKILEVRPRPKMKSNPVLDPGPVVVTQKNESSKSSSVATNSDAVSLESASVAAPVTPLLKSDDYSFALDIPLYECEEWGEINDDTEILRNVLDRSARASEAVELNKEKGKHLGILPEEADAISQHLSGAEELFDVNPCTKESERVGERIPFDYCEYSEFHQLGLMKAILFKQNRIKTFKTDQELKDEFASFYGPVDFEDPQMKKLLEDMRTTMEDIERQSKEPSLNPDLKLSLLDMGVVDPDNAKSAVQFINQKISHKFGKKRSKMFSKLDPANAEGEWFRLKRMDLTSIRNKYLPMYADETDLTEETLSSDGSSSTLTPGNSLYSQSDDGSESEDETLVGCKENENQLTNLHLYDPKFEFCFSQPYRFINDTPANCESAPSRMVSFRIMDLLNRYVYGITEAQFWKEYYLEHSNLPKNVSLKAFPAEVYIVKEQERFPTLCFPGFLEGAMDPLKIVRRLWHMIKCLLSRAKTYRCDEIFPSLEREFGIKFDYRHWGFRKSFEFLLWLAEVLAVSDEVAVFSISHESLTNRSDVTTSEFISIKSSSLKQKVLRFLEPSSKKKVSAAPVPVPSGFMGVGDRMKHLSNMIGRQQRLDVEVYSILSPNFFTVVPAKFLKAYETFSDKLQTLSYSFIKTQPTVKQLSPGMYVMAKYKFEVGKGWLWYRGVILWKRPKRDKFWVYGIDVGFRAEIHIKDIRFMPKAAVANGMMAIGIPVTLGVVHPDPRKLKVKGPGVLLSAAHLHRNVVAGRRLQMFFMDRTRYFEMDFDQWTVEAASLVRNTRKIVFADLKLTFEDGFELEYWEWEVKQTRKRRKAKKKQKKKNKHKVDKTGGKLATLPEDDENDLLAKKNDSKVAESGEKVEDAEDVQGYLPE